ncbi:MAG: ribosome small subunit-dependent GTPase A [Bacteriovoracaceae bacterium]|jgi:ribosome biogenesis GTPase|nr:ribosome small subunit-dependent GTPase A [Halobacteriovoraceae bacterium]MDP7319834.1 ribosome small subunit-dependent GTPase A [Bacteriovoracaceae bacterium]
MTDIKEVKIARSSKREFECLLPNSGSIVKAICLRELLKNEHLVVGDSVKIRPLKNDSRYEIFELIPRKNEIFRRIVRSNKKKVIASNVDVILIIASVSKPDYKPFLIDRYITRSVQWNIPAVIVFNKMDQFYDQFDLPMEKKKFDYLGINHFEISNRESSAYFQNIKELRELLKNKTAICLGQSGVGKSKLISTLSQGQIELLSSRLAKGIQKGAHTTTWAELIELDDFFMIDSPGVRTLSVSDISINELPELFPDINQYFSKCQFKDCRHEENSKGCFFNQLDLDTDEGYIIYSRLVSYLKMREEVEAIPEWKRPN